MTNKQVIEAWLHGEAAQNGALRTDGDALYSGQLVIGVKDGLTRPVAILYLAPHYVNASVSRHVGLARRHAYYSVHPPIFGDLYTKDAARVWVGLAYRMGWDEYNKLEYQVERERELAKKAGLKLVKASNGNAVYVKKGGVIV